MSADAFQDNDQTFLQKIPAIVVAAGFGPLNIVTFMLQQSSSVKETGSDRATALHNAN